MDISFAGAGFVGCYYFGVGDALRRYIPRDRINRVAGASAGSLVAVYYVLDLPLHPFLREIVTLLEDIRKRPFGVFDRNHQIVDLLPKILDRVLPDDAHKRISNRVYLSLTRLKDMKNVLVNEFESKKDLIDAINCSCFIPVWSGNHTSTYKGSKYIDGGFTDNLPVFDEHTIKICCFAGRSDISPLDKLKSELLSASVQNMPFYLNFANMRRFKKAVVPPSASYILDILERGYQDAKNFILDNDLILCNSCYRKLDPNRRLISPKSNTISPCISPALSRVGSQRSNSKNNQENNNEKYLSQNLPIPRTNSSSSSSHYDPNFNQKLCAKLRSYSVCEEINDNIKFSNNPTIIIEDTDETQEIKEVRKNSDSLTENNSTSPTSIIKSDISTSRDDTQEAATILWKERFIARRATLQSLETSSLIVQDRFKSSEVPLPSCPPSPSLNRHCLECSRLRQEVRLDHIDDQLRAEVVKFMNQQTFKEGNFKSKLASPIKWIKKLGSKSSYTFVDTPPLTAL